MPQGLDNGDGYQQRKYDPKPHATNRLLVLLPIAVLFVLLILGVLLVLVKL